MTFSQHIILAGLPGAGKSTVAQLIGQALGMPVIDTDELVENISGLSVSQIFAQLGEAVFRDYETDALKQALGAPAAVISLGGGLLTSPRNRELLSGAQVVYLEVSAKNAAQRLEGSHPRPLLQGDEELFQRLQELFSQRHYDYETVATFRVVTDTKTEAEVAQEILNHFRAERSIVQVQAERAYSVVVGYGLEELIASRATQLGKDILIVHPPTLRKRAQNLALQITRHNCGATNLWEHSDAESGKTVASAESGWSRLGELNYGRDSVIVALGGGATTDLAGFLAATWLRGVPIVMCPTTLLGMVDAAVGGKTGINTAAGKNLVGSFYSPAAVFCDLRQLDTLSPDQVSAGLAEVLKCGYIRDDRILNILDEVTSHNHSRAETDTERLTLSDEVLRELVTRAIRVKAEVVGEDFKESGLREILNFGHTFGHAIEKLENYSWQHGFAVSVGMVYAMELAAALGQVDSDEAPRLRLRLKALGLPIRYEGPWEELYAAMLHDKKVRGGVLRFVLPTAFGEFQTQQVRDLAALQKAAKEVGVNLG